VSTLKLGTRGSQLALWQANTVKRRIEEAGGPRCDIVVIKTSGDRLQEAPLSEVGGKRLFVKEIEDALLRRDVDLAVHSSKDMPALLPEGLAIAGVLPREEPLDAVVLPIRAEGSGLRAQSGSSALSPQPSALLSVSDLVAVLGESPTIGTSSVRRVAQLTRLFPGARFAPIRGNLDTRLRKVDEGQFDAIVLAAAGLRRLGFAARISMTIPAEACVPSPGQGIVAIEIRGDDEATRRVVARIEDPVAAAALRAERAVVERLGGGCQTPIGALAMPAGGDELDVVGAVVALDGSRAVRAAARGPREDAVALGTSVGEQLLAQGADDILAEVQRAQGAVEGIQP
jgi:hydroxymethylbilane synthase